MNLKSQQQLIHVMIIGHQILQHVDSNIQTLIKFKIAKGSVVPVDLQTTLIKMMI